MDISDIREQWLKKIEFPTSIKLLAVLQIPTVRHYPAHDRGRAGPVVSQAKNLPSSLFLTLIRQPRVVRTKRHSDSGEHSRSSIQRQMNGKVGNPEPNADGWSSTL